MIYLDANAGTPMCTAARQALSTWSRIGADPRAIHREGTQSDRVIEQARYAVLKLVEDLDDPEGSIIFTSGAEEAATLALYSACRHLEGSNILVCTTDPIHVLSHTMFLSDLGVDIRLVGTGPDGRTNANEVRSQVDANTLFCSFTMVNDQTGVVNDVLGLASTAKSRFSPLVYVDASQAIGRVRWKSLPNIDMLGISAHTFYGPRGVGALWIRDMALFNPPYDPPENNVPAIIAMAEAGRVVSETCEQDAEHMGNLRNLLEEKLLRIAGVSINCVDAPRVCNTINIRLEEVEAEPFIMLMSKYGICVSGGSCSDNLSPSHVMHALGKSGKELYCNVRFSIHVGNTEADIYEAAKVAERIIPALRKHS
jgi:cysteine desulfurase